MNTCSLETYTQTRVSPTIGPPDREAHSAPQLGKCPKCGKRNVESGIFDFQGPWGRQNLCQRHFDEEYDLCRAAPVPSSAKRNVPPLRRNCCVNPSRSAMLPKPPVRRARARQAEKALIEQLSRAVRRGSVCLGCLPQFTASLPALYYNGGIGIVTHRSCFEPMSDNPAFDFLLNIAAAYTEKLLTAAAGQVYDLVRGSPSERAVASAYQAAFGVFLAETGKGLSQAEQAVVAKECQRFFELPGVRDALLAMGLTGSRLDIERLEQQFGESGCAGQLANIRFDLSRGLQAFEVTLADELLTLAGIPNSQLFNQVVVHRLAELQRELRRLVASRAAPLHSPFTPVVPLQKPPRTKYFTGRTAELAKLMTDLQPGAAITLCGPAGMGKSALAVEAIWLLAPGEDPPERFPDGIIFHTFYHQPQADYVLEKIALTYGLELRPTPRDAAQLALAGKRALLVLDGAEVADALPTVLAVAGACGVLITTRKHNDAPGNFQDIEPLPRKGSINLLRAWAGEYADDDQAVNEIVRLLGGLPLALFLVGRYLREQKQRAQEYVAWLAEQGLAALHFGERPSKSVPLLLAQNLSMATDAAREAFGVAGVLALAPFDGESVAAGLDLHPVDAHRFLGELVNYGLLLRSDDGYQVTHALAYTYAHTQIAPSAETIHCLALHYAGLAERQSKKRLEGFAVLDRHRSHIIAVQTAALRAKHWDVARKIAWNIRDYLDLRGYAIDRIAVMQSGLDAARAAGNRYDEEAFLAELGLAFADTGEMRRAIELHEQRLVIARETGERRLEGNVLGNLGFAYAALGETSRAIKYHKRFLKIAREINDRKREGNALGGLGFAYADLGEIRRAIRYHKRYLVISRENSDRRGEGNALGGLGLDYAALGDFHRAIQYHEQALVIDRESGDRRGESNVLGNLGNAYADLGDTRHAVELYEQQLVIAREIGDRSGEANGSWNLGRLYEQEGDLARAAELMQVRVDYEQGIGHPNVATHAQRVAEIRWQAGIAP